MKRDDILSFLKSNRKLFENEFGVIKIGLFGSYAKNKNSDNSDIDLVIELKRENKADNYFKLLHFLEDNLNKKIDLGVETSLKKSIKDSIKREVIYV